MSREIKFRAWDKQWGKMLLPEKWSMPRIQLDGSLYDDFGDPLYDSDYIVEQYTGLKDKNGKEIYEGDIIREKWYDNDVDIGRDRIGKIEYFCDRFVCWFGGTFGNLGMFPSENIEVIGNIHENKELLGGEE